MKLYTRVYALYSMRVNIQMLFFFSLDRTRRIRDVVETLLILTKWCSYI
jgi:hypothetical protein